MSDADIRALERAVISGDETLRPDLERAYMRTGAVDELVQRLTAHIGKDWACPHCLDGRGEIGHGGTMGEMAEGLLADKMCGRCFGTGTMGPLRYTRGAMAWDLRRLTPALQVVVEEPVRTKQSMMIECFSLMRNEWHDAHGVRAHIVLVTAAMIWIASAEPGDWVGSQLLTRWANRVNVRNRTCATSDIRALERIGGTAEPAPLVALWSGASSKDAEPRNWEMIRAHASGQPFAIERRGHRTAASVEGANRAVEPRERP